MAGAISKEKPVIGVVSRDTATQREKKTFVWNDAVNNTESSLRPGAKLILWDDGTAEWAAGSQSNKPGKESHAYFEFRSPTGKLLFFLPGSGPAADGSYNIKMESANTAYKWTESWDYDTQHYPSTHACIMHHFSK